eukprot:4768133-Alexandrium_andersonii.AAC.1
MCIRDRPAARWSRPPRRGQGALRRAGRSRACPRKSHPAASSSWPPAPTKRAEGASTGTHTPA